LKFCRARNWELKAIQDMFIAHTQWFKERDMVNLASRTESHPHFNFLKNYMPSGYIGFAKDNHHIYVDRIGLKDGKGLVGLCSADELIDFHYYKHFKGAEAQRKRNKEIGQHIDQIYVICDLTGLGWQHADANGMALMKRITKMDEDNFPEGLKKLFIINAPGVFTFLWAIFRPWLNENTLSKIEILGDDYKDTLFRELGEDVVPQMFQGRNPTPIPPGGLVEGYSSATETTSRTITVPSRDKYEVHVNIEADDILLCWEFSVESNDVGFEVTRLDSTGKCIEIQANARYDAALGTTQGSCEAVKGRYTLKFDNEYSYFTSKNVTFRIMPLPRNSDKK